MGVKSLWTLLTPVGRPVMLETVEGNAMAIDSSIWIYQFQATMRDKEGRALINAHVLGFLRRISKLLFYGIRPVFVFDGGAPALKRTTLNERKQKKSGAASSHIKVAEKLLAAQMRKEALNLAQGASSREEAKQNAGVVTLTENTVYLEDLEGSSTRTPTKKKQPTPTSSASKTNKYRDHDPYRLPEIDMEETISKATRTTVPDPRLATEEELRTFIEEMRPEDFDIYSPAFRELPTEIQYEIIGDLRLKSRQTSYARLQKMLQTARTPLDFSKQQIQNLRQRNALTQQLLITTNSIGSAHIAIPIRIASERNKQYVLIKNEGDDGGWILGIQDIGTREKPITIDHEDEQLVEEGDTSDGDMEEVEVPGPVIPDPDLRQYQREMALSTRAAGMASSHSVLPTSSPEIDGNLSDSDDDLLAIAIQQSLEDQPSQRIFSSSMTASTSYHHAQNTHAVSRPNRLETALSIAGTPHRIHSSPPKIGNVSSMFGKPVLLTPPSLSKEQLPPRVSSDGHNDEVFVENLPGSSEGNSIHSIFGTPTLLQTPTKKKLSPLSAETRENVHDHVGLNASSETIVFPSQSNTHLPSPQPVSDSDDDIDMEELPVDDFSFSKTSKANSPGLKQSVATTSSSLSCPQLRPEDPPVPLATDDIPHSTLDDTQNDLTAWSRTPSPIRDPFGSPPSPVPEEEWDAAHEIDVRAEEGEFARFMSQVKGRNIDDIRKEIDEEIKHLNQQRKAAMRDSEDITQQMITQIMTMLRLFGIPYITAPMEAEAQCAELVSLNLVDGVITDDSDVFLFGAQRVYKNMFNQSKTVECFLLSDLSRELGLDRDTLIRLAYLLGSDYTEGLPGVGPVVAMELLKEFQGHDGLHKFKDWWTKVQSGKDREQDNQSKFRRQFKKKFKDLYLPSDWPNSVVRDAYYHPTVDSSEEPFKWGLPDLDGLRLFFNQELGWKQSKVDELLLPIIQRMNKRNQAAALNRQGNLNEYLDISAGSGTHAPRHRQVYASKRLQQVISDFRKQQKNVSASPPGSRAASDIESEGESQISEARLTEPAAKKRRTDNKSSVPGKRGGRVSSISGRGRRRRTGKGKARTADSDEEDMVPSDQDGGDDFVPPQDANMGAPSVPHKLRPRPKPRPTYRTTKEGQGGQLSSGDIPLDEGAPS